MFLGLRLDGLVRGDNKKDEVNATHTGEHIFNKPLVSGHVYKTEAYVWLEIQMRKPEIDGDTATLLFFEPVRVDASQGTHQRGFPVVDMAGRPHYDISHADDSHRTTRLQPLRSATGNRRFQDRRGGCSRSDSSHRPQ